MSSIFGNSVKMSVFGESHGVSVGVTLHGLPSGAEFDMEYINRYLARRATGKKLTSARREPDEVKVLSGVFNGVTTGAPLTMVIYNADMRSGDYGNLTEVARPSHTDYTAYMRYKGYNDYRGSGHFSGRLTAAIVMGGAVAAKILESKGIYIAGNIIDIAYAKGKRFDGSTLNKESFDALKSSEISALAGGEEYLKAVDAARMDCNSVGGHIECAVIGMPAGVGSPMFDGVENRLSAALFGVPAVKGIEFGEPSELIGSVYNDSYRSDNGKLYTLTNHDGGINGGITNGMPILFTVKIKPTPSIAKEQQTVNFVKGENAVLSVHGRHDPCIALRAVPVIEAMTAVAILDILMENKCYE